MAWRLLWCHKCLARSICNSPEPWYKAFISGSVLFSSEASRRYICTHIRCAYTTVVKEWFSGLAGTAMKFPDGARHCWHQWCQVKEGWMREILEERNRRLFPSDTLIAPAPLLESKLGQILMKTPRIPGGKKHIASFFRYSFLVTCHCRLVRITSRRNAPETWGRMRVKLATKHFIRLCLGCVHGPDQSQAFLRINCIQVSFRDFILFYSNVVLLWR